MIQLQHYNWFVASNGFFCPLNHELLVALDIKLEKIQTVKPELRKQIIQPSNIDYLSYVIITGFDLIRHEAARPIVWCERNFRCLVMTTKCLVDQDHAGQPRTGDVLFQKTIS